MEKNRQIVKLKVPMPAKVYDLAGYTWNKKSNQQEAYSHYVGVLESLLSGDPLRLEKHKAEVEDIFSFDLALNTVSMVRAKGVPAKIFCVAEDQKPVFRVKGQEFDWIAKDIRTSTHPVPERFRSIVRQVRDAGVGFDGFFIAEPDTETLPVTRKKKDPVLLGVIGRWLLDLGRWD